MKIRTVLQEKPSGLFSLEKELSVAFVALFRTAINVCSKILYYFHFLD